MASKNSRIIFEYSPLECASTEMAYDLCSPVLKPGVRVLLHKVKGEWSTTSWKIVNDKVLNLNFATYVCEVFSNGNINIISVGDFN